jgi:diacylglycerol kinase family enzyme
MRVVIVANPRSGSGRAVRAAMDVAATLNGAGIDSTVTPIGPGQGEVDVAGALRGARALLVAGGDGSVVSMAEASVRTGVPLYHVPTGNENLFAREHAHSRRPERVLAAVQRGVSLGSDVGHARIDDPGREVSRPFVLMASMGPDASVIARLDAVRSKAGGHLAYAGPILDELLAGERAASYPRVRVWIDGRCVTGRDGAIGTIVVANSRHYALRINPAAMARVDDGLLDVVFTPCQTAAEWLTWQVRLGAGLGGGVQRWRGAEVVIETLSGPAPVQIDGEAFGRGEAGVARRLHLSVRAGVLPVLRSGA